MKAVLISVHPKWCERIASGKKTIEVRKTKPKLETPFKCYIYCTKSEFEIYVGNPNSRISDNGKVIGDFICDRIEYLDMDSVGVGFWENESFIYIADLGWNIGLKPGELINFLKGTRAYGWHISNLVIYDKPRKLNDFKKKCHYDLYCERCYFFSEYFQKCYNEALHLRRPPQSWCYVEEVTK